MVVCDPPCENGICVANDTCNCTIGYEGERCSDVVNDACNCTIRYKGEQCSDSTEKSLFHISRLYLQMLHATVEKVLMVMG